MEATSVQPVSSPSKTTAAPPAVPHVDPKAALKIETAAPAPEEKKVTYGEKTFFAGILFTVIIIISVAGVVYFWTQNSNQVQKPVSVQSTK